MVVISHTLWKTRFASDPGVVGRMVKLGTATATVVGGMPEGFAFPEAERIWAPLRADGNRLLEVHPVAQLTVVARFLQQACDILEAQTRQLRTWLEMPSSQAKRSHLRGGLSPAALRRLLAPTAALATTAAACPFIGLFGTVWGIMQSFRAIGTTGSTSIVAVAPGISEALVNTAAGLAAAIPALIFYNYFMGKVRQQRAGMEDFALEFINLAERNFT